MALTDLSQLTRFMAPYYQDAGDQTLLQDYLTKYTYPECAASALWYELAGKAGLALKGVQKIDTGAEKFGYSEPGTMQLACNKQGDYYAGICNDLNGVGSCVATVDKATVGGVTEVYG